jgi:hypothetical protein
MGQWIYVATFSSLEMSGRLYAPAALSPSNHCAGGWVDPRTGLDDVEKRIFLTLTGLELRPLGRPARSQSLYRLRYVNFGDCGSTTRNNSQTQTALFWDIAPCIRWPWPWRWRRYVDQKHGLTIRRYIAEDGTLHNDRSYTDLGMSEDNSCFRSMQSVLSSCL